MGGELGVKVSSGDDGAIVGAVVAVSKKLSKPEIKLV